MIVLFRPFKINDFIEADSITGNVKQIGLFSTSLLKADNTLIIIPNSRVMSNKIINFSDQKIRRIDIDIVIDTQQNVQDLKKVIMDILLNDYRVLSYPSPAVIIHSFK
jgi:small conductance mechanosensitive channel